MPVEGRGDGAFLLRDPVRSIPLLVTAGGEAAMSPGPQGPVSPASRRRAPDRPGVRVGHVHLRTADIDRIRAFYVDVLGFDVVSEARDVPGWGTTGDLLFVSAGGYHHHLAFNTWKSAGGAPSPTASPAAPRRDALPDARVLRGRLAAWDAAGRSASSRPRHAPAIYISDPDGNDLEFAWDRRRASGRSTPTARRRPSSATSTSTR